MQTLLRIASACARIFLPVSFVIGWVAFIVMGAIPRGARDSDFTADFGVTEWLIDYSGGFVRRGLFGEVLHFLWDSFGLHPATVAVVVSTAAYAAFCIYALRATAKLLPAWTLWTTALLAAPLYTRNVIRKDVALLLVFVACVKVAQGSMRRSTQCVVLNALLILGLLLHESFAFFALPAAVVLIGMSDASAPPAPAWKKLFRAVMRGTVFCLPSVFVLACLVFAHGSPETARLIHASWKSAFLHTEPWLDQPRGSVMWVGFSTSDALNVTWDALLKPVFGIPSGVIVAVNSLTGVLLVRAFFRRYASPLHARVFQTVCLFQFAALMPLFLGALDSGRWLMFALLSSFVLTIECHERLAAYFFADRLEDQVPITAPRSAAWLPILSLLYAICPVTWSVIGYVMGTPPGALWNNLNRLGWLRPFM